MSDFRTYAVGDRVVITDVDARDPYYGKPAVVVEIMQPEALTILKGLLEEDFEQALFMKTDDGEEIAGTNRYVSPEGTPVTPRPGKEAPFEDGLPPVVPSTHWFGIGDRVQIVSTRHDYVRGAYGTVVEIAPDEALIRAKLRGRVPEISEATQALFIRLDEPTGHVLLDYLYRDHYPVANTDLALIVQSGVA